MKTKPSIAPKPNKSRLIIGIMLGLVVAGGVVSLFVSGGNRKNSMVRKAEVMVTVLPPPLPPPPPPPPAPPPPPKEQEMVEQKPIELEEPEPTPVEAPQNEALSTNIAGNGPDMGLRASTGGSSNRNQIGSGRRGGKWDHYAITVQNTIAETLRRHADVRHAAFSLQVRVWADANGRITRANLVGSSGVSAVDQAIKNQVLKGLQLPEPPPADMPMPINMRITARSANLSMR